MKTAKCNDKTTAPVTENPWPRNPHIFDAKTIHTSTGAGLLVESRKVGGVPSLVLVHLANGETISLTRDGAAALKVLLDEWVEAATCNFWLAS